jgi:hypothetical protein
MRAGWQTCLLSTAAAARCGLTLTLPATGMGRPGGKSGWATHPQQTLRNDCVLHFYFFHYKFVYFCSPFNNN